MKVQIQKSHPSEKIEDPSEKIEKNIWHTHLTNFRTTATEDNHSTT